jgi:hypothetical protein
MVSAMLSLRTGGVTPETTVVATESVKLPIASRTEMLHVPTATCVTNPAAGSTVAMDVLSLENARGPLKVV